MRMKVLLLVISLITPLFTHADDIVVVANTKKKINQLDKKQVRDLFMGGVSSTELTPVSLPPFSQTRLIFNTKVVGLTESRIQSYWAQMRFSGRNNPPKQLESPKEVIAYLLQHEETIGYLPDDVTIPDGLTVLFSTSK